MSRVHPVQITRVCRNQDRPLLSLGWSRLCLRAVQGAPADSADAAAPARGQEGEAAVVARKSEGERHEAAPAATKEQVQEEATSNTGLTTNRRHRPENEKGEARDRQEQRTKRLVGEQRMCTVESQRTGCVP